MYIRITRTTFTAQSTGGELTIDGRYFCDTLEDVDRKLEAGGTKVQGQTAIPRGTYPVAVTYSNRFQKHLPILAGVKGFTGIRIHAGNTAEHTEGCILVGTNYSADFVHESRATFAKLLNRITAALDAGDKVTIEIA